MTSPDKFENLVKIMDRLRSEDGCPWDREQTFATLRGYLLEECYEVVEALDHDDCDALQEELGDLLFQIVFLARIGKERGAFDVADVVRGISEKMIRRHPHVFADATAETSADVLRAWEQIKAREKAEKATKQPPRSVLDGLPEPLPALPKAQRLGDRAARVGFDWSDAGKVLDQVQSELDELREAMATRDAGSIREELGDVIFSTAMLARHLETDAEAALESANRKFARRFRWIEEHLAASDRRMDEFDVEALEALWLQAKQAERNANPRP